MKKSRMVVSVSTSMKDECVSLPNSKSQLPHLHDDDEDVLATSVIDRYAARPHALQNICLATFAAMYDAIQSSMKTGKLTMSIQKKICRTQKILMLSQR